jgi:hypothetical protein
MENSNIVQWTDAQLLALNSILMCNHALNPFLELSENAKKLAIEKLKGDPTNALLVERALQEDFLRKPDQNPLVFISHPLLGPTPLVKTWNEIGSTYDILEERLGTASKDVLDRYLWWPVNFKAFTDYVKHRINLVEMAKLSLEKSLKNVA